MSARVRRGTDGILSEEFSGGVVNPYPKSGIFGSDALNFAKPPKMTTIRDSINQKQRKSQLLFLGLTPLSLLLHQSIYPKLRRSKFISVRISYYNSTEQPSQLLLRRIYTRKKCSYFFIYSHIIILIDYI